MIQKITNKIELAKKRLMSQYKDSSVINMILEVIMEQEQALEDAIYDVSTLCHLDTAFGIQLDRIGTIPGIKRYGLNDEDYRKRIYAQIVLNCSNGEAETLITALKLIMNAPFLHSQMQKLCLAGIKKIFLYQDFSDTKFTFAERYLEDFNLVVGPNKDKIIVDSQGLEYNVLLSTGEVTEPSSLYSLSDEFTVEGQEVEFIGGRLMERLNK